MNNVLPLLYLSSIQFEAENTANIATNPTKV